MLLQSERNARRFDEFFCPTYFTSKGWMRNALCPSDFSLSIDDHEYFKNLFLANES